MKTQPSELSPYMLFLEIDHAELLKFLKTYMRKINPWVVAFWLSNIAAVTGFILYVTTKPELTFEIALAKVGLGFFLFMIVLLPVHELIHGMVYKLSGAPTVQYKANFKQLIFYALADKFVVSRKEFTAVAIMPFIVINLALILGILVVAPEHAVILFGGLILHIGGCFGDFALISFFYHHRDLTLVTFDDAQAQKSFFYRIDRMPVH